MNDLDEIPEIPQEFRQTSIDTQIKFKAQDCGCILIYWLETKMRNRTKYKILSEPQVILCDFHAK